MSAKIRRRHLELTTLEAREVPALLTAPAILKTATLNVQTQPAKVATVSAPSSKQVQIANTTLASMPTSPIATPASSTGIDVSKNPGAKATLPTKASAVDLFGNTVDLHGKSASTLFGVQKPASATTLLTIDSGRTTPSTTFTYSDNMQQLFIENGPMRKTDRTSQQSDGDPASDGDSSTSDSQSAFEKIAEEGENAIRDQDNRGFVVDKADKAWTAISELITNAAAKTIGAIVSPMVNAALAPVVLEQGGIDPANVPGGVKALTQDPDKRPGMPDVYRPNPNDDTMPISKAPVTTDMLWLQFQTAKGMFSQPLPGESVTAVWVDPALARALMQGSFVQGQNNVIQPADDAVGNGTGGDLQGTGFPKPDVSDPPENPNSGVGNPGDPSA